MQLEWSDLRLADKTLQALCLRVQQPLWHKLYDLSQLIHLRKLHLTIGTSSHSSPFQSLSLTQLRRLRDLALQCRGLGSSGAAVILSNQYTLKTVTLASSFWDPATYLALRKATALAVLNVKVHTIEEGAAEVLGNLSTPKSVQIMLRCCDQVHPHAVRALSSGCAKITLLSLQHMPGAQAYRGEIYERLPFWKQLHSMQHLTTLVISMPMQFYHNESMLQKQPNMVDSTTTQLSGAMLQKQPKLSTLYLVNCWDVTEAGVEHMVEVCFQLSSMLICSEDMTGIRQCQHHQALVRGCLSRSRLAEKDVAHLLKPATVVCNLNDICFSEL